jgi:alkylation response protein AidB-like acyl-CoA dehydrogenase
MTVSTLRFGPAEQALGEQTRAWLAANDPGPPPGDYAEHMQALIRWQGMLYEAGFVGLSWPVEYGGRGLGLAAEAVLTEELGRSSMPELINRLAVYTWGPTLLRFGTAEQRARLLRPMLDGSEIWCQGFSEPDAGSDLAGVRTMARREDDVFVVSGQKVWTSRAELSRWNALLVRTNPAVPPHRGLSLLIVDMTAPGITVRPLRQMLDEPHFSEVFFDDVRVPAANVLGKPDHGWQVAMAAMGFERGLFVLERSTRLLRRFGDLVRTLRESGVQDDDVAARLGVLRAHLDVLQARVYSTLAAQVDGTLRPGATSVDKLLLTVADQELFATAFDLLGDDAAFADHNWSHDLMVSRSVSIYSGTSEIQKNVIAKQLLGLHRGAA